PPVYVTPASAAVERMSQQLAIALADLTTSFRRGMTATAAAAHLETARAMAASLATSHEALIQAEQSLRFNRFRRSRSHDLANLHMASRALEHCAIQTRVMCRSIVTAFNEGAADWLAPEVFGRALADLFGRNTALVRYVGGDRIGVRPGTASTAGLQQAMRDYWQTRTDRGWLYAGEVLTVAERMATELQATIDALTGTTPAATRPADGSKTA
ncbi:MAG: hypothetical protein M3Y37_05960, partial [Chloroflexota bacterium]|nr:hypothetical protein [Chloroflexota bacterium]